jgi:hypothetical protein
MKQRFQEGQFSVATCPCWLHLRLRDDDEARHPTKPEDVRTFGYGMLLLFVKKRVGRPINDQPWDYSHKKTNISDHSDPCLLNFQQKVTNSCWILPKPDRMLRLAAPATATSAAPAAPVAPAALRTPALPGLDPWGKVSFQGTWLDMLGINPGEYIHFDDF